MDRTFTNALRFILDECLPPIIRDNRLFMYPFFYYWFKGQNIRTLMDFKARAFRMTGKEFAEVYRTIDCRANDRPTDLSNASLAFILSNLDSEMRTLIDIGCGRGFFMAKARERGYEVTGCDLFDKISVEGCRYVQANVESLPFADKSFDIVTCFHTLEHVQHLDRAIAELKRIARKQVVVVTPCQRPYTYTLDLHLHFFPLAALLGAAMNMEDARCTKIGSDWVYFGQVSA